jgi:transposase InsO family protein
MRPKIEKYVQNCINCILAERKSGKLEGWLHPIDKEGVPLGTYHIDHLGPLPSTKKKYVYIFAVIDGFTKFVWLYPVKTTSTAEVIDKLVKQSAIFGNPRRIVSDQGSAFTSHDFKEYCKDEGIEHTTIVTGVPRGNGQIERVNRTLIPLLTKLTIPNPAEWHKYVEKAQRYLNNVPSRSTGMSPFYLLFGTRMKMKEDPVIRDIIEIETATLYQQEREKSWNRAKQSIAQIQEENKKTYNKKRKIPPRYQEGDIVAIKRTQGGPGLKFAIKYLGPYRVTKTLRNERYIVEKIGEVEGPRTTSTAADHMKPWEDTSFISENRYK